MQLNKKAGLTWVAKQVSLWVKGLRGQTRPGKPEGQVPTARGTRGWRGKAQLHSGRELDLTS